MTATSTIQHRSERATDKNAIRPFHVNVPEADLTELRRRIKATRWPNRKRMHRKACSSRRCRNSPAIGRQSTTGARSRRG